MSAQRQPGVGDLFASPANFLALGFGTGLAPVAPGTVGTLVGIPVLLLMPQSLLAYAAVVLVLFLVGVWCCGACADALGVHDHGAIVWDEIVGYLITLFAIPPNLLSIVLGFALFRLFDVWKPWPVRQVDEYVHGGLGIMLDDVLAAVYAAASLQLLWWFVG